MEPLVEQFLRYLDVRMVTVGQWTSEVTWDRVSHVRDVRNGLWRRTEVQTHVRSSLGKT